MGLKIVDGSIVHDNLTSSSPPSVTNSSPLLNTKRRNSITSLSDYKKNKDTLNNSNNNINQPFENSNNFNNNSKEIKNENKIKNFFQHLFSILLLKNPTMIQIIETLELSTNIYNIQFKLKYLLAICVSSQIIFKSSGLLITLLVLYLGTFFNKISINNKDKNKNNNTIDYSLKNNNIDTSLIKDINNSVISNNSSNSNNNNINNSNNNNNNNNRILSPNQLSKSSNVEYNKCKCKSPTTSSNNYLSSSQSRVQTLSSPNISPCNICVSPNLLYNSLSSLSSSLPINSCNYSMSEQEGDEFESNFDFEDSQYEESDEEDNSSPAFHLYSSPNLRVACNKISTFSPNGRKLGTN
ncbi:hypothetical protein DDB_G0274369 [Dictyostelium discoideum AX4]|uniref:Putative uncharacterized protein DDB_G0274369 n=1 Tax=Dictyostelium discoideum TaxID=44689 RepID=Y7931_DICDI|nr:hypothetical protein DDB_G0274369 [Dictyostelium discoideum AX4]Q86IV0.1 RecName: Full=Putative uncharacterized protein DDB_G0274369 [Dictyostelium discoideum]EAL70077.1 hypothetical protein DDB_G0274369 [Dictyostelium discoideum AX4]|eukprot:XP_643880.1 hypothetical protein DDB_G0274369 [Dictyostelium discoideum AX4]